MFSHVKTSQGIFSVKTSAKGLYAVRFPGKNTANTPGVRLNTHRVCKKVRGMIAAYFRNPAAKLNLKLDLSGCTKFEKKVYRALRRVPAGKVLSYGELAKRAGYPGAARAVGSAMKKNRLPIVVPCHRVIPAAGGLGEYSAGKKWKRWLLEHEKR
jgi:methylated-DNA-[protein]-cysteine S-methyltransferase